MNVDRAERQKKSEQSEKAIKRWCSLRGHRSPVFASIIGARPITPRSAELRISQSFGGWKIHVTQLGPSRTERRDVSIHLVGTYREASALGADLLRAIDLRSF